MSNFAIAYLTMLVKMGAKTWAPPQAPRHPGLILRNKLLSKARMLRNDRSRPDTFPRAPGDNKPPGANP